MSNQFKGIKRNLKLSLANTETLIERGMAEPS